MENNQNENKLAERLRQLLDWKGISQYKLAKDTEISRSHVSTILKSTKGKKGTVKGLSDRNIKLVADYFDVDYNYLKNGTLGSYPKTSARTVLNTFEAFKLEGLMTDEDIWYLEQQRNELDINIKEHITDRLANISEFALEYMYTFLDSILLIDNTQYAFLHFLNQLNSKGIEKLSKFMSCLTISHDDSIKALPQAMAFYKSEKILDKQNKTEASRQSKLEFIENHVLMMDEDKMAFFSDHFDELLSLTKFDFQMLKRFALLGNSEMKSSALGYKIPSNYEVIFDYLEELLSNPKATIIKET